MFIHFPQNDMICHSDDTYGTCHTIVMCIYNYIYIAISWYSDNEYDDDHTYHDNLMHNIIYIYIYIHTWWFEWLQILWWSVFMIIIVSNGTCLFAMPRCSLALVCLLVDIFVCIYIYMYMYTYIYIFVYIYINMTMHVIIAYIYCDLVAVMISPYDRLYIYIYIHTYIHTYIYIMCIYIYIQSHPWEDRKKKNMMCFSCKKKTQKHQITYWTGLTWESDSALHILVASGLLYCIYSRFSMQKPWGWAMWLGSQAFHCWIIPTSPVVFAKTPLMLPR